MMAELGKAGEQERHWLYVCPACGTHDFERKVCNGYGPDDEHDPVETERVRIVDASEYDALDLKLAITEAERDALRSRVSLLEDALREVVPVAQDERYSNEYLGIVVRSHLPALSADKGQEQG